MESTSALRLHQLHVLDGLVLHPRRTRLTGRDGAREPATGIPARPGWGRDTAPGASEPISSSTSGRARRRARLSLRHGATDIPPCSLASSRSGPRGASARARTTAASEASVSTSSPQDAADLGARIVQRPSRLRLLMVHAAHVEPDCVSTTGLSSPSWSAKAASPNSFTTAAGDLPRSPPFAAEVRSSNFLRQRLEILRPGAAEHLEGLGRPRSGLRALAGRNPMRSGERGARAGTVNSICVSYTHGSSPPEPAPSPPSSSRRERNRRPSAGASDTGHGAIRTAPRGALVPPAFQLDARSGPAGARFVGRLVAVVPLHHARHEDRVPEHARSTTLPGDIV